MEDESCVPPGFRFHPTEEELVGYYLRRKINSLKIDLDVIIELDLYKIEPWDIQGRCKLGYEEQKEWYFFSHKDRKYPTGRRTNRATGAGFWKATGRDKAVLSKESIIGMRKTLVYYKGRAPTGVKTDWIMHEYRLQSSENGPPQEEGWVVCRAFKKSTPNQRQENEYYYRNENSHFASSLIRNVRNLMQEVKQNQSTNCYQLSFNNNIGQNQISDHTHYQFDHELIDLPQLDSPSTVSTSLDPDEDPISNHVTEYYSDMFDNFHDAEMPKLIDDHQPAALFSFPNMPLIPCDDDDNLDSQSNMNLLLGCFPDF